MNEPDVALTNFVIVIECLVFGWACARRPRTALRNALVVFFTASAIASSSAGVVHGYLPDAGDPGHATLWTTTMLAVVAASAALGFAAVALGGSPLEGRKWRVRVIVVIAACLTAAILYGANDFRLAVAVYVPASLWLALALVTRWRRRGSAPLLIGAAGLVLSVLAGALQQLRQTPVPELLSYNAWYHVLQIVAFGALFTGCWKLLADRDGGLPHD